MIGLYVGETEPTYGSGWWFLKYFRFQFDLYIVFFSRTDSLLLDGLEAPTRWLPQINTNHDFTFSSLQDCVKQTLNMQSPSNMLRVFVLSSEIPVRSSSLLGLIWQDWKLSLWMRTLPRCWVLPCSETVATTWARFFHEAVRSQTGHPAWSAPADLQMLSELPGSTI
jgi:hypothetical protein